MKLYYAPGACSLADHIALAEAGLPYDLVKVDLRAKTTEDEQDFSAINPKGYVPALTLDNGETLTENIAVLSYIGTQGGGTQGGALLRKDGLQHFRVLETTSFVSTELHKNFKPFFNPASSEAEKDEARKMLGTRFGQVAELLDGRDYIVGDVLSVADCYLFVMLMWADKNEVDVPEALTAYAGRLISRPAFTRALREEGLA